MEEAESAVGALRAGLEQQPAQWQAAVEGAVAPLAQSMDTLQLQQGEAGRALDAVQGRLGEAEAAVAELQAAASKQPRLWQGDIQGAFTPLRVQVGGCFSVSVPVRMPGASMWRSQVHSQGEGGGRLWNALPRRVAGGEAGRELCLRLVQQTYAPTTQLLTTTLHACLLP